MIDLYGYECGKQGVGVGIRALASIVDGLVFFPVSYLCIALLSAFMPVLTLDGAGMYVTVLFSFIYYTFFEGIFGATIGKMVVGLRVIKTDGAACDLKAAAIRTLFRTVDSLPFAYIAGAIAITVSQYNQRIGDRFAGTIVTKKM